MTVKDGNGDDTAKANGQKAMPHIRTFTAEITENGIYYGRVDVGLYVSSVYSNINKTSFYIVLAFCIAVIVIGKGSQVTIYLPAVAEAVSAKAPEQILPTGKGVVVVAEEDTAIHEQTQEMLSYLGYQYVACRSLEDIVQEVEAVDRAGRDNIIVLIASNLIGDVVKQNVMEMFNSLAANVRYIFFSRRRRSSDY